MKLTKICPVPLVLCAALLTPLAGCGDDDSPGPSSERPDGGSDSAGAGDATGSGGAGGGITGSGGSGAGGSDAADVGPAVDVVSDAAADTPIPVLTDGQVVGLALELNRGEVTLGALASTRAKSTAVKTFAAQMVTEHGAAVARLMALVASAGITPAPSSEQDMLAAGTASTTMVLSPLGEEAFDRAYADSQVDMHMKALELLDTKMIPSAQNASLKAELTSMRTAVTAHLEMARQLL
jgi:putative membrane protein